MIKEELKSKSICQCMVDHYTQAVNNRYRKDGDCKFTFMEDLFLSHIFKEKLGGYIEGLVICDDNC